MRAATICAVCTGKVTCSINLKSEYKVKVSCPCSAHVHAHADIDDKGTCTDPVTPGI